MLGQGRTRPELCWDRRSRPRLPRFQVSFALVALESVPFAVCGGVRVDVEDAESRSRCDSTIGRRAISASQSRDNRGSITTPNRAIIPYR